MGWSEFIVFLLKAIGYMLLLMVFVFFINWLIYCTGWWVIFVIAIIFILILKLGS